MIEQYWFAVLLGLLVGSALTALLRVRREPPHTSYLQLPSGTSCQSTGRREPDGTFRYFSTGNGDPCPNEAVGRLEGLEMLHGEHRDLCAPCLASYEATFSKNWRRV